MAWLGSQAFLVGEKISKISLFVLAQLTNVTDGQTDREADRHRVTAIAALCIASHGKNHRKLIHFLQSLDITFDIIILSEIWKCNPEFYHNKCKKLQFIRKLTASDI